MKIGVAASGEKSESAARRVGIVLVLVLLLVLGSGPFSRRRTRMGTRTALPDPPSHRPGADQLGEPLEAAVVGALDLRREAAAGELSHVQVIAQALAADPVSLAARISAFAQLTVMRLLAFHALGFNRLPDRCQYRTEGPSRNVRAPTQLAGWQAAAGRIKGGGSNMATRAT